MSLGKIVRNCVAAFAGIALLVGTVGGTYTITETQQAVVTRQGKPVRVYVGSFEAGETDEERIKKVRQWADENGYEHIAVSSTKGLFGSGLHLKWPSLLPVIGESVEKYPDQLMDFQADPEKIRASDLRQLIVDNYCLWYIENVLQFSLNAKTITGGNARIDDNVYSDIRDNMTQHSFNENIRTTNRTVRAYDGDVELEPVEYGREEIIEDIISDENEALREYGIKVVDIRFIRVDLPPENETSVFDRMISERQRIASMYRAEGKSSYLQITSEADRDAAITIAEAQEEAGRIRGEGEAEAAKIYTDASRQDPDFFAYWRTLEAYKEAFGPGEDGKLGQGETRLVLTTDSEFLRMLDSGAK